MNSPLLLGMAGIVLTVAIVSARGAGPSTRPAPLEPSAVLFAESFDDADLAKRGWYDGDRFRITPAAQAGKGCIEYDFPAGATKGQGSQAARRLFEPTDDVYLRFYLRLSKDFAWTGKGFHPHLVHFLTTENDKFKGPAATHLTLYCEPVDGKLRLGATDIENKDARHGLTQGALKGGYNGKLYDSEKRLFAGDDQWHCIEAH